MLSILSGCASFPAVASPSYDGLGSAGSGAMRRSVFHCKQTNRLTVTYVTKVAIALAIFITMVTNSAIGVGAVVAGIAAAASAAAKAPDQEGRELDELLRPISWTLHSAKWDQYDVERDRRVDNYRRMTAGQQCKKLTGYKEIASEVKVLKAYGDHLARYGNNDVEMHQCYNDMMGYIDALESNFPEELAKAGGVEALLKPFR